MNDFRGEGEGMSNGESWSVTIGGNEYTREQLMRAVTIMASSGYYGAGIPDGYVPDPEAIKPHEGNGDPTPEERLHELLTSHGKVGRLFRHAVKSEPYTEPDPEPVSYTPPTQTLHAAGFPAMLVARSCTLGKPHEKIRAWAEAFSGTGTPWLWIIEGTDGAGIEAAAQVALGAQKAMDEGRARNGRIRYVEAYDLCGTVESSLQYADKDGGPTSYQRLQDYATCALLIIHLDEDRATARRLDMYARLIRHRRANGLPTVLVSRTGLSRWLEPFARIDGYRARAVGENVMQALGDYEAILENAKKAMWNHVVDLRTE